MKSSIKGENAMNRRDRGMKIATVCLVLMLGMVFPARSGKTFDKGLYGELLSTYAKVEGVDYKGLKDEEERLDRYLKMLAETDPDALPRNEQFALYINAYNAYTLKLILKNYPVDSIKDIGGWFSGPWKIRFCKIGGKTLTLDEIEHDILRPRFKDPRVHFAINCASKSCPPLIPKPYEGSTLDQQLDGSTRGFLNNPQRNRLEGDTLYVSKIFKWFADDFKGDVVGFFLKHAEGDMKARLSSPRDRIKIEYLDYDWGLNGT
jgi:hypothetical protein